LSTTSNGPLWKNPRTRGWAQTRAGRSQTTARPARYAARRTAAPAARRAGDRITTSSSAPAATQARWNSHSAFHPLKNDGRSGGRRVGRQRHRPGPLGGRDRAPEDRSQLVRRSRVGRLREHLLKRTDRVTVRAAPGVSTSRFSYTSSQTNWAARNAAPNGNRTFRVAHRPRSVPNARAVTRSSPRV
jgi:hypothetical protein